MCRQESHGAAAAAPACPSISRDRHQLHRRTVRRLTIAGGRHTQRAAWTTAMMTAVEQTDGTPAPLLAERSGEGCEASTPDPRATVKLRRQTQRGVVVVFAVITTILPSSLLQWEVLYLILQPSLGKMYKVRTPRDTLQQGFDQYCPIMIHLEMCPEWCKTLLKCVPACFLPHRTQRR